jgi:hypothetical protein
VSDGIQECIRIAADMIYGDVTAIMVMVDER